MVEGKRNRHNTGKDEVVLWDGTVIEFRHNQECCEIVYADIDALDDTGFDEDTSISKDNISIELVEGFGIRLNGYGIPCHNSQNGYYSSNVSVYVDGRLVESIDLDSDLGIADYYGG